MPKYLDKQETKSKAIARIAESEARDAVEYLEREQDNGQDLDAMIRMVDPESRLTAPQRSFLLAYTVAGTVSGALRDAHMSHASHYNYLNDAYYRSCFEIARQAHTDGMEEMAFKLATGRLMKPIVNQGKVVTYERIIDTKMLAMILRALKPERYTERLDMTTTSRTPMKIVDKDAWESI